MKKRIAICFLFFSVNVFPQETISLNGKWKIHPAPPDKFWKNETDISSWKDIDVPGECLLQGIPIRQDIEFACKRKITIPSSFAGKHIRLRFDGVYSYARVWVNGKFVRDHTGGFTTWYCDITSYVKPGSAAWITVEITDKRDDISRQSDYAHHLIGGILRDVTLEAWPENYLTALYAETEVDVKKETAVIKVNAAMHFGKGKMAAVVLRLHDPYGKEIPLSVRTIELSRSTPENAIALFLKEAKYWSAEDPLLYTLTADVWCDDEYLYTLTRKIGIRQVEIRKNVLMINGKPVKLRGVCRHDAHPLYGRSFSPDIEKQDVMLMKQANINFVRTSHYPPSEHFLDLCDRYGIYVEVENAVCFLHNHPDQLPLHTDRQPYVQRALEQMNEIIQLHRHHPSVILWSTGNESMYGEMFRQLYQWVKKKDPTRPVIFSYPFTAQQKGVKCYDVYSLHYPSVSGSLQGDGYWQPVSTSFGNDTMPELNDEYAHVSCYNKFTLRYDPAIRDFWGNSISRFWDGMFNDTSGCLGGAIWAWADEVFYLPDTVAGYGPWGIVDGWRRPKPEYWHVKKAYSPVKILDYSLGKSGLTLTIHNRFDHLTLARVTIRFTSMGKEYAFRLPHTHPHTMTRYLLPRDVHGDSVDIAFYLDSLLIDAYRLPLKETPLPFVSTAPAKRLSIDSTVNRFRISNEHFSIVFDRHTGKILTALAGQDTLLTGGPFLNLGFKNYEQQWETPSPKHIAPVVEESRWQLTNMHLAAKDTQVMVVAEGRYDSIAVKYFITLTPGGKMNVRYQASQLPSSVAVIGARYRLPGSCNEVAWRRKGQWDRYPADHIGRLSGVACRACGRDPVYRQMPSGAWKDESVDFFLHGISSWNDTLFGKASRDFICRKCNVLLGIVRFSGTRSQLMVMPGQEPLSLKMDVMKNNSIYLNADNFWSYPDIGWGVDAGSKFSGGNYEGEHQLIIKKWPE